MADQYNSLQAQLASITNRLDEQDERMSVIQAELKEINAHFFGAFYADLTTRADDLETAVHDLDFTVKEGQMISNPLFAKVRSDLAKIRPEDDSCVSARANRSDKS